MFLPICIGRDETARAGEPESGCADVTGPGGGPGMRRSLAGMIVLCLAGFGAGLAVAGTGE